MESVIDLPGSTPSCPSDSNNAYEHLPILDIRSEIQQILGRGHGGEPNTVENSLREAETSETDEKLNIPETSDTNEFEHTPFLASTDEEKEDDEQVVERKGDKEEGDETVESETSDRDDDHDLTGNDVKGDDSHGEEESSTNDSPEGDPEALQTGADPNELTTTEIELAHLLVSTPKLANGGYNWQIISENASEELQALIKEQSRLKRFRKAPIEHLLKHTQPLTFREYLIRSGWKQKMPEPPTSTDSQRDTSVAQPKTPQTPSDIRSEDALSALSKTEIILAHLMVKSTRLADGKYDWNAIRDEAPANIQATIDSKLKYPKFHSQPVDYIVPNSRRKIFRHYLAFLVHSPERNPLNSRRKLFRNYLACLVHPPERSVAVVKPMVNARTKQTPKSGRRKSPSSKVGSDGPVKEADSTPLSARNNGAGNRLKINVKKLSYDSIGGNDERKHGTTKRKRTESLQGGDSEMTSSENIKELGKLEQELAELVELTPKVIDQGRNSYDWDEIQRRASPDLKKLFESKKRMKMFRVCPLEVLMTEEQKCTFHEYREQLRKTHRLSASVTSNDIVYENKPDIASEDNLNNGNEGPLEMVSAHDSYNSKTHRTVRCKISNFSPGVTVVNQQYKILSYTPTATKGFLEYLKQIRQERLAQFLDQNRLNKQVAEQMLQFQNEEQEIANQCLKDFLMPRW